MGPRKRSARRLLVASIGVAVVAYACEKKPPPEPVGNLVAPDPTPTTSTSADPLQPEPPEEPVGNLVAPDPDPQPEPAKDAGK